MNCLSGQSLKTPDEASLELELTAQVGHWPLTSLQPEEVAACEKVSYISAI